MREVYPEQGQALARSLGADSFFEVSWRARREADMKGDGKGLGSGSCQYQRSAGIRLTIFSISHPSHVVFMSTSSVWSYTRPFPLLHDPALSSSPGVRQKKYQRRVRFQAACSVHGRPEERYLATAARSGEARVESRLAGSRERVKRVWDGRWNGRRQHGRKRRENGRLVETEEEEEKERVHHSVGRCRLLLLHPFIGSPPSTINYRYARSVYTSASTTRVSMSTITPFQPIPYIHR